MQRLKQNIGRVSASFFLLVFLIAVGPAQGVTAEESSPDGTAVIPLPKVTPFWKTKNKPQQRRGVYIGNNFYVEMPVVGAGLRYEFMDETRENRGVKTMELYHRFAERVGFRTRGWVYHPALLSFTATIEPELSQTYEEDSSGRVVRDNIFTPDYLLSATLLERTPYTLQLHANRKEVPSWAPYQGGFNNRTHDFGGLLKLDIRKLLNTEAYQYATFSYNRRDLATEGFYDQEQVSDDVNLHYRHQNGTSKSRLSSLYVDRLRTVEGGETRTRTFNLNLDNRYIFRQQNRVELYSSGTYRQQELDGNEYRYFYIDEFLNATHRDNLKSFYKLRYDYQDSGESYGASNLSAEARLQHRLFENLTTTAGSRAGYNSYQDGSEIVIDPFLDLGYNRKLPGNSTLALTAGWEYLSTYRSADTGIQADRSVQHEEHLLFFGQDAFLKNYNVVPGSIVVTSPDGTIRYMEGIDYELEQVGDYVSVRSLSLGSIDNGTQVYVNYLYQVDPEYDDGIFRQSYSIGYGFLDGFNAQLVHSRGKQYILDGAEPTVRVNDTVNRASLQHRSKWSNTRFEVTEFDRASDITYRTWQATQRINIRPLRMLSMSVSGYYGQRLYDDQAPPGKTIPSDTNTYGGMLGVNWRVNPRLVFSMEGFSNISDSDIEDSDNTGIRAALVFNYRIWSAKLTYELSNQSYERDSGDISRLRNYVRFDIVRLYW